MNNHDVTVIISTYNGEKYIERQLNSIFTQEGVSVNVFIRDDHSKDNTINIINTYQKNNPNYNITVMNGENEGYAKSFWDALRICGNTSYYAFSDQDDVWKKDKLIKCIQAMEKDTFEGAKLSYCGMIRSDINLKELDKQIKILKPEELTKGITLTKTYNYGAATVINHVARELICRCWPEVPNLPHDTWIGTVCYWFGKVYYVEEALYFWIRYNSSVTGAGTKNAGYIYRFKQSLKGNSYPNVAKYLLSYYNDMIDNNDRKLLHAICSYKNSFRSKKYLLKNKDFRRDSFKGTFILKMGVLFNWF